MMDHLPSAASHYALSFTTGALLLREGALLAPIYLERREWGSVRAAAVEGNLLQARTYRSGVRLVRETVKRLSALTDDEVELVVDATATERAHLMWTAACRRYDLIGEFAEEVLRERYLTLAPELGAQDFDSFVRTKALWHEELATTKPSTLQKLRSNLLKMLREAEFLSDAGYIMPAVLSERVLTQLSVRVPSDVRFFPTQVASERGAAQ